MTKTTKKIMETPSVSFEKKVGDFVLTEVGNLKQKQAEIQKEIEKKNTEAATLRETLLVVNGALQGVQHVHDYITREAAAPSSIETKPAARASSSEKDA